VTGHIAQRPASEVEKSPPVDRLIEEASAFIGFRSAARGERPLLGDAEPPIANNRSRISRTVSMNSRSRDPTSRNIADFTVALVVSGPGVKSSLSLVMDSGSPLSLSRG